MELYAIVTAEILQNTVLCPHGNFIMIKLWICATGSLTSGGEWARQAPRARSTLSVTRWPRA